MPLSEVREWRRCVFGRSAATSGFELQCAHWNGQPRLVTAGDSGIWVANYGDHTAVVFDRTASGNVAPKRIIRNAPKGTPTTGFTNASAAAYDSKRDELLVPN